MTPNDWAAILFGTIAVCGLVAYLCAVANGTGEERREYEEKRAREDAEALLRGETL